MSELVYKEIDKKEINDEVVDKYTPSGMKKASDDGVQYACYVPKNWVTDLSDKMTYAYYPESGKPNVTVTSYTPDVSISLKDYFLRCEEEYKKVLPEYERSESEQTLTVGGRTAYAYTYTTTVEGTTVKVMQTIFAYNEQIYSVTYTALADRFDAHRGDVDRILSSFTFR